MENIYHTNNARTRRRRTNRKRPILALVIALILIGGVFLWNTNILGFLWKTTVQKEIKLKQTPEEKINLLLLGVGGGTHEGPDLTDTIIFASVDPQTKRVTLVSLPRDLWAPEVGAKVNSVYTFAKEKDPDNALEATKKLVGGIMGQQIDYAVKIDFDGFVQAVDIAGGLDIDVARTFDDYEYPIEGKETDTCGLSDDQIASMSASIASGSATEGGSFPCRYEHLHFTKGQNHMDGKTALKYVRSRHALGPEGSDFARSKRQEKVISAFRSEVFSAGTILNPVKFVGLLSTLKGSIETDIKQSEYADFVNLAEAMKGAKISSAILDQGDSSEERLGLLMHPDISPEYNNAWVLAPRAGNGDYSEIRTYIACAIRGGNCMVGETGIVTPTPKPKPSAKVSKKPQAN